MIMRTALELSRMTNDALLLHWEMMKQAGEDGELYQDELDYIKLVEIELERRGLLDTPLEDTLKYYNIGFTCVDPDLFR